MVAVKKPVTPPEEEKIKCIKCGTSNQAKFYMSRDKFHQHFHKIPYCKDCCKEIYLYYLQRYKNMNLSLYYMCRKLDVPYINTNYQGAIVNLNNPDAKIQGDDAIVQAYMKGLGFSEQNGWGNSFDDSIGENEIDGLASFDDITKIKRKPKNNNKEIDTEKYDVIEYDTDDLQQIWGMFDNEDLAYLQNEYLDWDEKLNGINEKSIDIMVKQICLQCNEIRHDREQGQNADKKVDTLQKLLNNSGLIEKQNSVGSIKTSTGQKIEDLEKIRPVKKVDPDFEDVDDINKLLVGYIASTCKALGKTNAYTEKFDELYKDYTIDLIEDIKETTNEEEDISDTPVTDVVDEIGES